MTSILRLSKERSSFRFRRQTQDSQLDSSSGVLDHRLPAISPLDTRSFAELFDPFRGQEEQIEVCSASPQDLESVKRPKDHPTRAINRNDSTTSSCYSQPSQRESEYSPFVTRQSSSSSYAQEPPITASKNATDKGPTRPTLVGSNGSGASVQGSRSTTNSSSLMTSSLPPDLDKPLPPGPSERQMCSASAPHLPLRQNVAELPSESSLPPEHPFELIPVQRAFTEPSGSLPSNPLSGIEARSDLSSLSTKVTGAVQSNHGHGHRHRRHRSASETIQHQTKSVRNERPRRSSTGLTGHAPTLQPPSRPTIPHSTQLHKPITAATAEQVIYRIMCNLRSVRDLQSTAMVSKGFLRTFQRNQSNLVSHLTFTTSKPAWELRRTILGLKGSSSFVLKDFSRDCKTLSALKAYIVGHCSSTCKPSILVGLLGQDERRQAEIDDALWRIWTFCVLFGNAVGQSGSSQAEIDWLNGSKAPNNKQLGAGFAIGNGQGLTIRELEDMNEMWQCLQALMAGFHGREEEAKQFGVYDNWHPQQSTSESQHLAEWISYLLALGPQTVLSLSSRSFERAKMLGLTNWPAPPAGKGRSSFLVEAMTQVYQERVLEEATLKATQFSVQRASAHRATRSVDDRKQPFVASARTATSQARSLRIDTSGAKKRPVSIDAHGSARFEIRPDCDPANLQRRGSNMFPASPTADPSLFYALNMTSTASTKLGATLFPMDYASPRPRVPFPAPEKSAATGTMVVDPVDKAMAFLVHDLGFDESRARKALAMCDTGSGINLQKAVELLAVDAKDSRQQFSAPVELPAPVEIPSPNKLKKQPPKAYCDGQCKRTGTMTHSRSRSASAITDISISPMSAPEESEWQDTISPLVASPMSANRARASMYRGPSRSTKTWKVLGMDTMLKRKNSVLGIDEYQAKVERRKSMRALTGAPNPRAKDGLSKNLLGLGLAIGSGIGTGTKSTRDQPDHIRDHGRYSK